MVSPAYVTPQQYQIDREEIERQLDVRDLVSRVAILPKRGIGVIRCPFPDHDDTHPSFSIFRNRSGGNAPYLFDCHGCGRKGGPIEFLKYVDGLTNGEAFKRAKELAGLWRDNPPVRLVEEPGPEEEPASTGAAWQHPDWQTWAEAQVARCYKNMRGGALHNFEKWRGLTANAVQYWEIGWSGNRATSAVINGKKLIIPAGVYTFPFRNEQHQIQMLKFRRPEGYRGPNKYGNVAGGTNGVFNLAGARNSPDRRVAVTKGEFEVMLLWELGYDACCATGGEGSHVPVDELFEGRPAYYIADNDQQGRMYARQKAERCGRLLVTFPPDPHKDLTDIKTKGQGLDRRAVEALLGQARVIEPSGRRRKTQVVELPAVVAETEEKKELPQVRAEQYRLAAEFMSHPVRYAGQVLNLGSPPGAGKGYQANEIATDLAAEKGRTTAWYGQRHDQYGDQDRDPEYWKQLFGRRAAKDQEGNPVDFNSPSAVAGTGNCSVEGEKYHAMMAERGWEKEAYKYCEMACPLRNECNERGYLAAGKPDGRNAYLTYGQLPSNLGSKHKFTLIDESSYQQFVQVRDLHDADLGYIGSFTQNGGMLAILHALRQLRDSLDRQARGPVAADPWGFEEDEREDRGAAYSLHGAELYEKLDGLCRKMFHGNGLLFQLDKARQTNEGRWYNWRIADLLGERTVESAGKLPLNLWQVSGAEPGTGGLYDILAEEAPKALGRDGQMALGLSFISRLGLVKPAGKKHARYVLYRRKHLPAWLAKKPVLNLDGTGDPSLLPNLLTTWRNVQRDKDLKLSKPIWKKHVPDVVSYAPQVKLPECVKVTQDTRRNFSKTALLASLKGDPGYFNRYVEAVAGWLDHFRKEGKRTLLVCSQAVEVQLQKALNEKGITASFGYQYAIEHYGNLRGSNAYKEYGAEIQAGMTMPNLEDLIGHARALYAGDGKDLDTTMVRSPRIYDYKDDDGMGRADDVPNFGDERLQSLLVAGRESEHLQVAYRIRPLEATEPKEIVLLFGLPLPGLPVHTLITPGGEITARTGRVMEAMEDLADKYFEDRGFYVVADVQNETDVSTTTIYKYFDEVAARAGGQTFSVACIETMPAGRDRQGKANRRRVRFLKVAAKMGISREMIMTLINSREIPIPKNWRPARPDEVAEAPPELPAPFIETAKELQLQFRGEVSALLSELSRLKTEYLTQVSSLPVENFKFSGPAASYYEQYILAWDDLRRLTLRHRLKKTG
jgi:hypothetical protein